MCSKQHPGSYFCPPCNAKNIESTVCRDRLQRVGAGASSGASSSADTLYNVTAEIEKKVKEARAQEAVATDFHFNEESLAVCVSAKHKMGPFRTTRSSPLPHVTRFKHVFLETHVGHDPRESTPNGDSESEGEDIETSNNNAKKIEENLPTACETVVFQLLQMVATMNQEWDKIRHFLYTIHQAYVKLRELNLK